MKPCSPVPIHARARHVLSRAWFRYGQAVARCTWPFLVLPVLVLGELGAGLLLMETNDPVLDDVYIPRESQAFQDQASVHRLFPDRTGDHYDALELNEDQIMGSLIFTATHNASIYDDDVIQEIRDVIADVKTHVTIEVDGVTFKYEDLCGRRHNACVVTGERLLAPQFNDMRKMGILTYPKWKLPTTGDVVDLSFALADSDSELKRVGVVRVTFKLRHDLQPKVFLWEEAFVNFVKTLRFNRTEVVFSASSSVSRELEENFHADLVYMWLCLAVIAVCCLAVAWGGDVVSTRVLLVPVGVVSPALGVLAALGLLSYCKVKVVEMVWVVPLLVLGKGLSDMSLLMTSWSSRLDRREEDVEQRMGWCLVEVGSAITITSLSLSIAFCLGYTSSTPSVANFCLYAGVAMMFCYISTMMFGVGCLATHGRRVMSSRHTLTCCVTSSRDQLKKEGRSPCTSILCGGNPAREKHGDQSMVEKMSRLMLQKLTGSLAGKVVISILYLGVLAASVFGIINMKQGVELQTLVAGSSYAHDYLLTDSAHFGFSFPVVFVMDENARYNQATADLMVQLVEKAKQDPGIQDDFVRCWLVNFLKSSSYNLTTEGEDFSGKVVEDFLLESETFMGDVVLDDSRERILASRCYVFTKKSSDQEEMTRLMQRMRTLAAGAGVPVFAFHPAFLNYDQMLAILPTLFQTVGTAMGVLCVLYLLFFPEVVGTLVTVTGAASIMLGTMGLMTFLDVPVSFVSITPIILNMGFAIHFSVYVSAAYLQSEFSHRIERVADAVARAAVPVFLSALCITGGVLVLLAATSYSFDALFKVTLLTLVMVIFHCVFFTPVILSLVGHEKSQEELDKDHTTKKDMMQRLKDPSVISNETAKETWPNHITPSSETKIHVIGNGSPGQRYIIGNNLESGIPKADYENVDMCPHGLTSNSFENAGKSLSFSGYYNTPGQYENWTRRNADSRDVYDLPVSLPSTRSERREGPGNSAIMDTDFRGQSPRSAGRSNVSSPSSGQKSVVRDGKRMNSPGPHRAKQDTEDVDVVTGLKNTDDVFMHPPDYEPVEAPGEDQQVASLEGVHQVACTLSTSGTLGATQNYVTENFRDIPY